PGARAGRARGRPRRPAAGGDGHGRVRDHRRADGHRRDGRGADARGRHRRRVHAHPELDRRHRVAMPPTAADRPHGWRVRGGEAMVEAALAFPLLVLVALALVQLALYAHAENVVVGATQDGARVAAEADRGAADGTATAQTLLRAGLGAEAAAVAV